MLAPDSVSTWTWLSGTVNIFVLQSKIFHCLFHNALYLTTIGPIVKGNSGEYEPRHEASKYNIYIYIYLALGTDPEGDSYFSIYQNSGMRMHFSFKETLQCKPSFFFFSICTSSHFWLPAQNELMVLDIMSYRSQSAWACKNGYQLL